PCGFWLVKYSVYWSSAAAQSPIATRGSMLAGDTRLFSTRSLITCLALAKAASVASFLPNISLDPTLPCEQSSQPLTPPPWAGFSEWRPRGQPLVAGRAALGGVAGLGQGLGDDEGGAGAYEAGLFGGGHGLERAVPLGREEVLRHQMRGEAAELLCQRFGAGEHAEHARRGLGLGNIDTLDAGMGVRGEHRHPVALTRQADVIDIAPLSQQEALILHSPHSLPDAELDHVRPPFLITWDIRWNVSGERSLAPACALAVQPPPHEAEQALRHEDDHGDEDDPDRDEVELGEEARERLAQQQEKTGTHDGADQRGDAAHEVEDHGLA